MSAVLGQGPNSSSRDTYNNIFVLFCRKLKLLTDGRCWTTDRLFSSAERRSQFDNLKNRQSLLDDQMSQTFVPLDSFRNSTLEPLL